MLSANTHCLKDNQLFYVIISTETKPYHNRIHFDWFKNNCEHLPLLVTEFVGIRLYPPQMMCLTVPLDKCRVSAIKFQFRLDLDNVWNLGIVFDSYMVRSDLCPK